MLSIWIDIVYLKFQVHKTAKIVNDFKVMLIDRIKIISDYFGLVHLNPVFLILHPLHF